ncbi:hypothetical protein PLAN_100244 [Planktothrix rubescens CCAP 1459/22]|uniref:Uncharacterized protein n=1 Tax=Planktothrix rubescens CCAP 1459/22 TaxID=329571 RepID=A0A6J7ZFN8_PLARU|nr:hypothetical protein PLAN_100244 [Planktothrix rubescens NIVA-CYA 18]CAD0228895.1 hypothetical protein PL10110_420027 [Planktothrix agardhii]
MLFPCGFGLTALLLTPDFFGVNTVNAMSSQPLKFGILEANSI